MLTAEEWRRRQLALQQAGLAPKGTSPPDPPPPAAGGNANRPPWTPQGSPPAGKPEIATIDGPVVDGSTPVHAGYNFVPLSRKVFLPPWAQHVSHDFPLAGALSGQIPIRITARTPVIPGGAREKKGEGTVVAPFQLTDGTPAIPGSTLKGMIRSVVEIAGFGRISPVNDHRFAVRDLTPGGQFYKDRMTVTQDVNGQRVATPRSRAGFLSFDPNRKNQATGERGCWMLVPARYCRIASTPYDEIERPCTLQHLSGVLTFKPGADLKEKYGALEGGANGLLKPLDKVDIPYADKMLIRFTVPGWTDETSHTADVDLRMRLIRTPVVFEASRTDDDPQGAPGTLGFVVVTGRAYNRKREFVFHDWDPGEPVPVDQDVMDRFLATVSEEEGQGQNRRPSAWGFWLKKLKEAKVGPGTRVPGIPVFWVPRDTQGDDGAGPDDDPARTAAERGVYALGTSQMFKLPYDFGVMDMIDHTSMGHRPDPKNPDLAALIFGMVADEAGHGLKSRVSFGTARRVPPVPAAGTRQSPALPLASPKASYYPCYVRQRCLDNDRPATDRHTGWLGNHNARGRNQSLGEIYATYMKGGADGDAPRLRGWKRYPARRAVDAPDPAIDETSASATTLTLLPDGTAFEGTLHFHNLLPAELGALVWALTWGGDDHLRHGLGMGKAYGYGQVTIDLRDDGAWVRRNPATGADEPPDAETGAAARTTIKKAVGRFTETMEAWATSADGPHPGKAEAWVRSEQIVLLTRLAHPDNRPPKGGHRPMILGVERNQNNHFALAKGAKAGGGNVKKNLSSYALPEPGPWSETPEDPAILREE